MAVAWDSIPAAELADRAANFPMLGTQVIPVNPTYAKWVDQGQVGANSLATWTDRGDSDTPTRWTFDGYGHRRSTVSGATDDNWFLRFDLGSTFTIDYCAIIYHDFDTDSVTDVQFEIATHNDFGLTGSLYDCGSFTLQGSDKRLLLADFDHAAVGTPQRYTGVQYCGIRMDKTGTNFVPQIGEIFIGRTYQLGHMPSAPWDDVSFGENIDWQDTESGIIDQQVYYRRRFDLSAVLMEYETSPIADLKNWYRQTRGPFVWVYQPNSALQDWHFMMRRGGLKMPVQGYIDREAVIEAVEQGPESLYLDVEVNG